MYLWPPCCWALLCRYYGQGYKGVAKCFLWTLFPLWYAWTIPDIGLAFVILFASMILLSFAIIQGWFRIKKGRTLAVIWGAAILLPVFYLLWGVFFHGFEAYQMGRLTVYLRGEKRAASMLAGSRWLGKGDEMDVAKAV